jgi:hypothetical protein
MSWLASNDPVLGDARSCDALEMVWIPRVRDIGGLPVRRALPHERRQMVGPLFPSTISVRCSSLPGKAWTLDPIRT